MLYIKELNLEDAREEYACCQEIPPENGFQNNVYGMPYDEFVREFIPHRQEMSRGVNVKPPFVPGTWFFLWDDTRIVGLFKLRHRLNDTLREGGGHIGYGIRRSCRCQGYGAKGLALMLEKAWTIIPEDEVYMSVNKANPASLRVMQKNGAYIHHESDDHYFTRIKRRENTMMQNRTHTCNELRMADCGKHVRVCGWMENVRVVSGNLAFVILRDFYGTTQAVIESEEMMAVINGLNKETVLAVEGVVRERASKNAKIDTGDIEVVPDRIEVLGRCRYNALPFQINRSREADEAIRLKYRYLDLRNPDVKKNIIMRCNVVAELRKAMIAHDFLEITTPILTASSPEGARDYLVPARKHPGMFYALPQAPQQFKQLLMASGFDRYFQIAPCFRDEDARGDRSPGEFYQLDMEMAFASQEDVFAVLEDVLPPIFAQYGKYNTASSAPFKRIPYLEAMEKYGSDKPDLRIDLTVQDVTELLGGCGFAPFEGNVVKAVVVTDMTATRKQIDKLMADVEVVAGNKPYWFKVDEKGEIAGGIAKFVKPMEAQVAEALELKPNTLVALSCGKKSAAQKTAGVLVKQLGAMCPNHMDTEKYEFCWIVDFPMYEIGEESGELEFCHNPFSMPNGGLEILEKAASGEVDPLSITAFQYDLVCNGVELSSGAVRNHDPEIMIKAFRMVRLGEEDVKKKFPAMYNAFCYGAPPHAGIAPGVDRMVMLLAGEDSIREVIPFPMNKSAQDVMMGAPSTVEQKQLDELHIALVKPEE